MNVTVRPASQEDQADVASFTRDTWPDREEEDYLPRVFEDWVSADDADRRTMVADADGRVVGVVQAVLLSADEAWIQGMRVDPEARGHEIGLDLAHAAFDWARDRGAAVARNMVFSWNAAGLGHARSAGFEPVTAFRWAYPSPNADATGGADSAAELTADPGAAWTYWGSCPAREALAGLALDPDESWAVSALTRDRLARAADETFLGVVRDDETGTRGFAVRVRTLEGDDGDRLAEYGVGAWDDLAAARELFAAVARDAAAVGADRARVLIPEMVRAVSDVAAAGVEFASEPDFVLAADLTARG